MQTRPLIFISYRHGRTWTEMAQRLTLRFRTVAPALGFEVFMDDSIISGERWSAQIQEKLETMTHFICMLCDEYWESVQCQRELMFAVNRFNATGQPRLLFVLAERMSPEYLVFDRTGQPDRLDLPADHTPGIRTVSEVNFLGPFDEDMRLEPLDPDSAPHRSEQFTQLVKRLKETLPPRSTTTGAVGTGS
jgi:hypothetical protein